MSLFIGWALTGFGLACLVYVNDSWSSIGFIFFAVGISIIIDKKIEDAKEEIKQEILDEDE